MKSLLVSSLLLVLFSTAAAKDEIQIGDLVKQHLNSIGSEQARAAPKTRVVQGAVRYRVLSAGRRDQSSQIFGPEGSEQMGKGVLASEGNKVVSLLKLPNPSYHGERFVCDGRKIMAAEVTPGSFSDFGDFVRLHDEILTEGLWGGVLSTGWALAHLEERHAKLQYKGVKKIEGRELHDVKYTPAKHSDLQIDLYFDATTFRHVMTTYSMTISPQMGSTEMLTARQQEARYLLEEQFVNFGKTDDLELPGRWIIRFTENIPSNLVRNAPISSPNLNKPGSRPANVERPQMGGPDADLKPFSVEFDAVGTSISHNVPLDPGNFEIK